MADDTTNATNPDTTQVLPSVSRSVPNLQDLADQKVLNPQLPAGAEVQGVMQQVQDNELMQNISVDPTATSKNATIATAAQVDPLAPVTAQTASGTQVADVTKAQAATVAPTTQASTTTAQAADTSALTAQDAGQYEATKIGDITSKIGNVPAAQDSFTEDELLTGQLAKVMKPGADGVFPDWAVGVGRKTMQMLAARGIDSSTMAGQAIMAAVIDASVPIADKNAAALQGIKLQNLSNRQQAGLVEWQGKMNALLSDQAAENAAKQFNASSQTQVNEFIASLATDLNKFNAQLATSINTFNAGEKNKASLQQASMDTQVALQNNQNEQQQALVNAQLDEQNQQFNTQQINTLKAQQQQLEAQIAQRNADLATTTAINNAASINDMNKANAALENQREQFNVNNANLIQQSNTTWRRQLNTQNTAVANEVNRINALNKLQISNDAYNKVWQQFRDEALWAYTSSENAVDRATNMAMLVKEWQLRGSNAIAEQDNKRTNDTFAQIGGLASKIVGNFADTFGDSGGDEFSDEDYMDALDNGDIE